LDADGSGGNIAAEEAEAKVAHSDRFAQEAHRQSKSTWLFLGGNDSLRRLIAFRVMLEPLRSRKSAILVRNGEQWRMHEQHKAMGSQARSYPFAEASKQIEFHRALISITTLMLEGDGVQWCLGQVAGASHVDRLHRWRLTVRAGGAVSFVMMELSAYPWRGILLTSRGDGLVEAVAMGISSQASDGIYEFIADARTCPNMFHRSSAPSDTEYVPQHTVVIEH
jgi:hypothetical protein